jgi:hypothetical protein
MSHQLRNRFLRAAAKKDFRKSIVYNEMYSAQRRTGSERLSLNFLSLSLIRAG